MCFFLQMVKVFGKVLRTDALGRAEQWELSSGPKWKVKLGKRGGGRSPSGWSGLPFPSPVHESEK